MGDDMADKVEAATQTMIENLKKNTGKSLDQWVAMVHKLGEKKHGEVVSWLKTEHGMGHGFANLVALAAKSGVGKDAPAGDDLVAAMFAGEKSTLIPIYDKLIKACTAFGKELEISPKKTYVSLRRAKQFGLIQPTTKTRLDVGINLKGKPSKGRLEASGSFNAMVSHRVRVESAADVDKELIDWLKEAFEAAK